jgi:hypothetical protein
LRQKLLLILFLLTSCFRTVSADDSPTLAGKWSISWQARLGTERGTIQFQQQGTHLTGLYQGHSIQCQVSGDLKDANISFHLDCPGKTPFTIQFTGTLEVAKMTGTFQLKGFKDAYDQHGENVQSTDYKWTAAHIPDPPKSPNPQQKPAH